MAPPVSPWLFSVLLLAGMLILLETGRRYSVNRRSKESESEVSNLGPIESSVFALFGLLMAFTFSGAASRFNEKRMLIAEEANTIETAYLRLKLVSHHAQPALEELFRKYVDSRLETYRKLPDTQAAERELAHSRDIQEKIWVQAIAATRLPDSDPAAGWLLPIALNSMIDIVTTRTMSLQVHPPGIIYALLFGLGLLCSVLAGYRIASCRRQSWLHIGGFTIITVLVVYVTLDVEYPRVGWFRLDAADQLLMKVRENMK